MTDRSFIDTNIFVYAADTGTTEQSKRARAVALLGQNPVELVVSTQVLNEFYVVVTRKLHVPMPEKLAAAAVREMTRFEVVQVDVPLVLAAMDTSRSAGLSLWDALMIEAARYARCSKIVTEDLQHNQVIHGVTVHNPFVAATQGLGRGSRQVATPGFG